MNDVGENLMSECIECGKKISSNNFLCFRCKQREEQRDFETIEEKQATREFKTELRELMQDIPALRGVNR